MTQDDLSTEEQQQIIHAKAYILRGVFKPEKPLSNKIKLLTIKEIELSLISLNKRYDELISK